jgi:hypothetical protein
MPMCARESHEWSHVIKTPNVILGLPKDLYEVMGMASIQVGQKPLNILQRIQVLTKHVKSSSKVGDHVVQYAS